MLFLNMSVVNFSSILDDSGLFELVESLDHMWT